MGFNFIPRRRLESLPAIPLAALFGIGTTDLNYEKYDETIIFDLVNKNLDRAQRRLNRPSPENEI